ncbi:hypothetical protein P409_05160 [Inquilinus limosus MP06]|uniref:4Fe-4S ferredoxin-type domain-containing protein n=1 Tax=Inquilinus limosus MP06 TaxID=1398085 RepID=A0A0A0DBM3_9PROT|nr:hypothetical protein P409_05160 [Inquilinus limosus MP06]
MMSTDVTTSTTPTAPCTATGGDRIFSPSCLLCPAFAIGCAPACPTGAAEELELGSAIPTEDLKVMQRACAGSPCLATGESRTFSPACLSCPAFALWCFPSRAESVA